MRDGRKQRAGLKWGFAFVLSIGLGAGCSEEASSPPSDSNSGSGGSKPIVEVPSATPEPTPEPTPVPSPAPEPAPKPVELSAEELIDAGRSVYNANCIACHSVDPTKDGALGPAVSGASMALVEARVLRSEYPEGYAPKRPTKVMIALPHLEPRLAELVAYLNSLE